MIRKMIEEIIEKYYREDGEYYSRDREDESGNDLEMDEEIKSALEEKGIQFKVEFEYGFSSPGYDNDFLAIAWIEADGTLELTTVLLEIKLITERSTELRPGKDISAPFGKMNYQDFLNNKKFVLESSGFDIDKNELNPKLFDYEKDIVRWALAKGRAAIFADCGLGKTAMQLEWANQVSKRTGGKVLILAPLAVAPQTAKEGEKFGIEAIVCESQSDCKEISITNYEKLDRFIAKEFTGIVLDESSILKSFTGKVRTQIIDTFNKVPYKLACTATPSPNDYMELGNHSEFLGVMTRAEMLSMFFVHDGGETSKWRLKGHAENVFWQWMASWAVFIGNPRDLGYAEQGFDLPELNVNQIIVDGDEPTMDTLTLTQRRQARKESIGLRCSTAAGLVNDSEEQWLVWCDLNDESSLLHSMIDKSVHVVFL